MPRAKKALPAVAAPGQQYGQNVSQIQAQKVIPLPNNRAEATAPPPPQAGGGAVPAAAPSFNDVLQRAGAMAPAQPWTSDPSIPVTAGLPFGPGPGPEALSVNGPGGGPAVWVRLAQITGDQTFLRLAQQARFMR